MWGETGRYPLIYQSIRLTLNYYKRLLKTPVNSLVHAALKEQKSLKLPWYKNIEPLLKLDEIFNVDHVSAHLVLKSHQNSTNTKYNLCTKSNPITSLIPISQYFPSILNLPKAVPLRSEKFRVQTIVNTLSNHFTNCWEHEKSNSTKLTFYHSCKKKFGKEIYLDVTKGFERRSSTTKLRISAHELGI